MCDNAQYTVCEKIGDYKREMKKFVKGLVKTKLFQTEDGDLTITIEKNFNKELNQRVVTLEACSADNTVYASLTYEVPTRVFNKVDPTLFEALGEQLAKTKNFGKLIIK